MPADIKLTNGFASVTGGSLKSEGGFMAGAEGKRAFFLTETDQQGNVRQDLMGDDQKRVTLSVKDFSGRGSTITPNSVSTTELKGHSCKVSTEISAQSVVIGSVPLSGEEAPPSKLIVRDVAGRTKFIFDPQAGRLGVGTDNPQHTLHVEGSVAGRGQYVSLSDEREKTCIAPLRDALSKVARLRGVSYRFNTGDDRPEIGLLAQEVERVVPEAVHSFDSDKKGVAYTALIPILVEAVKELSAELDSLRQGQAQSVAR